MAFETTVFRNSVADATVLSANHDLPTNTAKMSEESIYVTTVTDDAGKAKTSLLPASRIDATNARDFRYVFKPIQEINKNKDPARSAVVANATGGGRDSRMAYGGMNVEYPDNTKSEKFVVKDCIIQYREKADERYVTNYLYIGIPCAIVDAIKSQASRNNLNLAVANNVKTAHNYYWFSVNTEKLDRVVTYKKHDDGQIYAYAADLSDVFRKAQKNLRAMITFTAGAKYNLPPQVEQFLATDTCTFTPKCREIVLSGLTDIDAPGLEGRGAASQEEVSVDDEMCADLDFAGLTL